MRLRLGALVVLSIFPAGFAGQQTRSVVQIQAGPPQSAEPAPLNPQGAVRVSGGVMAAHIMSKRNPDYPNTDAQGSVILLAIIGVDGKVQKLSVISGPEPLQKAALDAVRHWRYHPFVLNGSPVTVETTVTINFRR